MALLDKAALIAKINGFITTNGNNEITGAQLNEILRDIVDSFPGLLNNQSILGLNEYDPTEVYNKNDEGQAIIFSGTIYQAKPAVTNITGPFDPLDWTPIQAAASGFTEVVSPATTSVNVNHNLGKLPQVTCIDTNGIEIEGGIEHVDNDNLTATFNIPFEGTIECI